MIPRFSTKTPAPAWHLFVPKFITVLREGYSARHFRDDFVAGLTVAIVALPLSMALAIASGTAPERGLFTAIVAGLLISLFGGSRFQIGGPTGAFVVVVFNVIDKFGYEGLMTATLMAGVILIAAGYARFGTYIKYIPYPVVTGFTAGIAVIIFTSQIEALLGLSIANAPGAFLAKWHAYVQHLDSLNAQAALLAALSLGTILVLRRYRPTWPIFLIGIAAGTVVASSFGLSVDTIGSRFGGIPRTLPPPAWPNTSPAIMIALLPSAFTIAILAGIESLLSAVVADGMTGRRHRSNCELVAQGIANLGSALFGGIPATGAIARTATNIRAGARSPVSGVLHALFVLAFMAAFAPLATRIPLACLGAVLVVVAWNMSEFERFRHLMQAPPPDRAVLVTTFFLTVLVDLTVAIEVGVVLAAVLFMKRMAEAVEIQTQVKIIQEDVDDFARDPRDRYDPAAQPSGDVTVFEINGPFFFGAAARLNDVLEHVQGKPKVFILRMRNVPLIDATGVAALKSFIDACTRRGTAVVLAGVQPHALDVIARMGLTKGPQAVRLAANTTEAMSFAQGLVSGTA